MPQRRRLPVRALLGALVVCGSLAILPTGEARADTSMLAVPITIPGSSASNNGDVLRFGFTGVGPLTALPSIPQSLLNNPSFAAFDAYGELFVANRWGNQGGGLGSVARFIFDTGGNAVPNGSITGNGLEAVTGLAFSPTGELFASNFLSGTVSRFLFDSAGHAIPNGSFSNGLGRGLGLAFAPNGELFATGGGSTVARFTFDSTGNAVANGLPFAVTGASLLHGLAFSPSGELFVADGGTDTVFRFLFDATGLPIANGTITVAGGPIGVSFSAAGELFVTSHFPGGISRFLFH